MRVTLRLLGLDVLDLELTTGSTSPEPEDDTQRDLSGGYLGSTAIEAGNTTITMGFTNGMESGDGDD